MENEKPKNMIDEAKELNASIEKNLEALRAEREKMELMRAEEQLAGTAGRPEEVKPKEESNEEYTRRIEREIREGKYNDPSTE